MLGRILSVTRMALCALLCCGFPLWAEPTPAGGAQLVFGVSQAWAMPFARFDDGQLRGGILFDLMQEIAAKLGSKPQFLVLPPKRVEAVLQAGEVDLHCLVSPLWLHQEVPAHRWTATLLRMDDVLLAPAKFAASELDLDRAQGASVGLVVSYLYPRLDAALASGRLRREDAPTQELVFEKLLRGRSDFGVGNSLIADWFNKRRPVGQRLKTLQTLASLETACVLSPLPRMDPARIKVAVQQLLREGAMDRILQRYR